MSNVYRHGGGGVGQTPDLWDNAYFDGHYFHNGKVVPAKGFCTDVFFEQAHRFIRENAAKKQPFFAYISTNAPHGPLHTPQKYMDMYPDQPKGIAAFFGMITNIDDNVGTTRTLLRELGIERDTLFIFTTDNGTAYGARIFNAGMRGAKGSEYDGGHRVPLIAHWPAGGWNSKHTSDILCHAVDIVPTLLDITGAKPPEGLKFDGISIRALLDPKGKTDNWPDRMLITDSQRVRDPIKWKQTAVMSQQWRLINGKELYEIKKDPGQKNNVASDHPGQVAKMKAFYDAWWSELEPTFAQTTEIHLGHPDHPVVSLTGHDWIQQGLPPWNQRHVRQAAGLGTGKQETGKQGAGKDKNTKANSSRSIHRGHWAVKVVSAGEYVVSMRRWPVEADQPIVSALPAGEDVPGADKPFRAHAGVAVAATRATLRIDGRDVESKPVTAEDKQISFTVELKVGSYELSPVFITAQGDEVGAYYAVVTRK